MSTDKPTPATQNALVRGADGLIWDIAGVGPIVRASDFDKAIRQRDEYARQLAEVTRERDEALSEVNRLTDSMSWSEAKAHEDAANLRAELAALREADKSITLNTAEIVHLAKAANIIPNAWKTTEEDFETEYTILEKPGGVLVYDDDKTPRIYAHGAYLTEYPDEGTFPLGPELTAEHTPAEETKP